jgi:hypothetical protein
VEKRPASEPASVIDLANPRLRTVVVGIPGSFAQVPPASMLRQSPPDLVPA